MTQVVERQISGVPQEQFQDAVAQQFRDIINVLAKLIQFGDPQNPFDPASASLAGATGAGSHNGTSANIDGSWVEVEVTSTGASKISFIHNLNIDNPQYTVPVSGEPNVRWIIFGWSHDGTGKDGTSGLTVDAGFLGDTVGTNSIELRVSVTTVGTAVTVDGDHPILLTCFLTRATRGQ